MGRLAGSISGLSCPGCLAGGTRGELAGHSTGTGKRRHSMCSPYRRTGDFVKRTALLKELKTIGRVLLRHDWYPEFRENADNCKTRNAH